jgi:multiple sugar transport system substrate-binding protein
LPLNIYPVALFYNKDIFDRFGVAYPKDGLTWDEVIELAKILTRNENGQQYRGFDPQVVYALASSLPIDILDPRTDKASVLNDQWRMVLDVYKKIVTIPGNTPKGTTFAQLVEGFLKDKNVAMHASNMFVQMEEATKNGFNWDIAQYPQYKGYPNIGGGGQSNIVAVSKTSKHKEEVMKVIGVMLSDEVQLLGASRYARLSALKDQKFKDAYGKDVPYLKGKNIQSLFKSRPGEYANYSPLAGTRDVRAIFEQKVKEFVSGQKDFNTAMREAEEEMNKKVAELKGK